MGWLYSYDWQRPSDVVAHLRAILPEGTAIVAEALVAYGRRWYAALRGKDGAVGIMVCHIDGNRRGWGYKDVDETMGPIDVDCPLSVLNAATPTDNEWANAWREKCRQYWADRAASMRLARTAVCGDRVYVKGYTKNPFIVDGKRPLAGRNARGERWRIPQARIERVEHAEVQ